MENSTQEETNTNLINSFMEIASSTKQEALFFLESHQWDLDAAVSTFLDDATATATAAAAVTSQPDAFNLPAVNSPSPSLSHQSPSTSPSASLSRSPSRSRSPSPAPAREPYQLRSRRRPERKEDKKASGTRGGIRTLADLNRTPPGGSGSDDDEPQQYYTGGEKSGMLVQDPTRGTDIDVDTIFNQARHSAVEPPLDHHQPSSSSKAFSGTARLLTGETVPSAPSQPSQPEEVVHNITFWRNGFTVDDGPLRRMDDPANASFLESIMRSECPRELATPDGRGGVHVQLNKRDEEYSEQPKRRSSFQGVGRTLGSSATPAETVSEPSAGVTSLTSAPLPSLGLVVDSSSPTTSIQLRLADGTRMVSRFNYNHTIRDIHAFIDASRPGGSRNYQLQAMGFPPKQLTDLNQTIEQAGIANSVVIQKL
ncbi:plant UBX domain-containing protein 4-like [Pistacia vera]|uniref:plant UBX domain-containing protein 4-like n=1 Tax=Pistacia vera TaxID=55513 RepID=UPI001262D532|nr:plant UBX domain-containing protein 4-like [Pistacia vera]